MKIKLLEDMKDWHGIELKKGAVVSGLFKKCPEVWQGVIYSDSEPRELWVSLKNLDFKKVEVLEP